MGCYFYTLPRVPLWAFTFYMEMYMCISFEMKKKQKNLHLIHMLISVAVEIQPPVFYCMISRVPKKTAENLLQVVFKCIFEN